MATETKPAKDGAAGVGYFGCKCGECDHGWKYKGTPHATPRLDCPNVDCGAKGAVIVAELAGAELAEFKLAIGEL